ncbi:MAG: hypothetical protein V1870_00360 [Candidatus Aenigmatarchaeota archaeon]
MAINFTGIFMTFLRLFAYAMVIIVFIELVFLFSVVVNTHEMDKVTLELSENMMSSDYNVDGNPLTISRAVFSYDALIGLNAKKYIEPVRNCEYGARYEFYDLEKNELVASFGYLKRKTITADPSYRTALEFPSFKKSFYVGIARKDSLGSYSIVPGKFDIWLYDSSLARLSCAVEKAWYSNEVSDMKIDYLGNSIEYNNDMIVFGTEERMLPGITLAQLDIPDSVYEDARKSGKSVVLVVVPVKRTRYNLNDVCVDWREPGAENWKPDEIDISNNNRIICMKAVIE